MQKDKMQDRITSTMICIKCGGTVFFEAFCKSCFIENTERKIKKSIKDADLKKNEKIRCDDQKLIDLIKEQTGLPLQFTKDKDARIVIPWTADDEIEAFFEKIIDKKTRDAQIKLFKYLSDEELEAYSKIKGFQVKKSKSDIREFINTIANNSEAKAAMLKGVRELQELRR